MFSATRPNDEAIRLFLTAQQQLPYSYVEIGATKTIPPQGYDIDHNRIELGTGREVFTRAKEAVRRWANAAALVRPAADGGRVLCVGDATHPGLQALVRWDPGGLARREIEERQSAHLPPAQMWESRAAQVSRVDEEKR